MSNLPFGPLTKELVSDFQRVFYDTIATGNILPAYGHEYLELPAPSRMDLARRYLAHLPEGTSISGEIALDNGAQLAVSVSYVASLPYGYGAVNLPISVKMHYAGDDVEPVVYDAGTVGYVAFKEHRYGTPTEDDLYLKLPKSRSPLDAEDPRRSELIGYVDTAVVHTIIKNTHRKHQLGEMGVAHSAEIA